MENRILENLQHFLMTKVKEHIILWTLLERMLEKREAKGGETDGTNEGE